MSHLTKWIRAEGDEPVTAVAVRSLQSRLEPIQKFLRLAATKSEKDVEYVHQLRVWTRRADAAIELYRPLIPAWRAAWLEKQLGRIRKATNDARDDDVFAMRLADDPAPAAAALLEQVLAHRAAVQQDVRAVYRRLARKEGRFARRCKKTLKRVRLPGKYRKSAEPSYRTWAVSHLGPMLDIFFVMAAGDLNDTQRLHEFRIMGKNLRYAMELLSSAVPSELRRGAYPLLETLQEKLGQINDHASALDRIARWQEDHDEVRVQHLNQLMKSEQRQLEDSRREFVDWWTVERIDAMRDAFATALSGRPCD